MGDLAVIQDGSILLRDGRIYSVGTTRRIENLKEARDAAELDVTNKIVMPGFVDGGMRLSAVTSKASHKRKRIVEFYDACAKLMRAAKQHGTLNAEIAIGGDSADWRTDVALIRQIAKLEGSFTGITRTWTIGQPPEQDSFPEEERYVAALALFKRHKLLHAIEVTFPSGAADVPAFWKGLEEHRKSDLLLRWYGGRAETLAHVLSSAQFRCVTHAGEVTSDECTVLSRATIPTSLPVANCLVENRVDLNARNLVDSGAAVALATGYHNREMPVFNMQMIVSLAVLRLGLTVEQAISAATVNAAYGQGIGQAVGTIETGKRADLLVLDLPDYRDLPGRWGTNHLWIATQGQLIFDRMGRKVNPA